MFYNLTIRFELNLLFIFVWDLKQTILNKFYQVGGNLEYFIFPSNCTHLYQSWHIQTVAVILKQVEKNVIDQAIKDPSKCHN